MERLSTSFPIPMSCLPAASCLPRSRNCKLDSIEAMHKKFYSTSLPSRNHSSHWRPYHDPRSSTILLAYAYWTQYHRLPAHVRRPSQLTHHIRDTYRCPQPAPPLFL